MLNHLPRHSKHRVFRMSFPRRTTLAVTLICFAIIIMAYRGASIIPAHAAAMLRRASRSSAAQTVRAVTTVVVPPHAPGSLIEYRAYTLHPSGFKAFMALTEQHAALRQRLNPGWLGMFTADTGGALNVVHHFYAYASVEERARVRRMLATDQEWQQEYIDKARPFVAHQESTLLLEAADVHAAAAIPSAASFRSPLRASEPAVYEMRTYRLVLGYNPVPELRKAFSVGIPAKLRASAEGQLAFVTYSEVGELNKVVELWRFKDAAACLRHREASRGVHEWKTAIAAVAPMVQSFSTTFLNPINCSPWQ